MAEYRLERCPFCKGKAGIYIDRESDKEYVTSCGGFRKFPLLYYVKCGACGVTTNLYEVAEMAIAAWNRRQ